MKWLLCCGVLSLLSLNGSTQTFQGGLLFGFTASQVDGDSYAGFNKLGLYGGIYVSKELSAVLDAKMEIRYASRGARNPASDDNTGSYTLGLHYIDLPIIIAFRIKNYGAVEIGLVPGYLFHAHGKDDAGNLPNDYLLEFRKFDLGTLLGININITQKISVIARYSYSIFSIMDVDSAGAYYSWFGKIFGHSKGDFNNYLTTGLRFQLK